MAVGRIYEGTLKNGQKVTIKKPSGEVRSGVIKKVFTFEGTNKKEVEQAVSGDIVMIAGIADIYIGETVCENETQETLPAILVDEPTVAIQMLVNNSPFAGREGKFVTSRQIKERLERELEVNVGLRVDFSSADAYTVYGRGEMHIAILLEQMRREGFEMQVSQPQVILKEENGTKMEPFEEVIIDIPDNFTGAIIEQLAKRKGQLQEMKPEAGHTRLQFDIPTRGLLGYNGQFIIETKGEGILCSRFIGFRPHVGTIDHRSVGSMVSMATGKTMGYSLATLQDRGMLYIEPATEVYEGMVLGNTSKGDDMAVNPIKGKNLTNMRSSGADKH